MSKRLVIELSRAQIPFKYQPAVCILDSDLSAKFAEELRLPDDEYFNVDESLINKMREIIEMYISSAEKIIKYNTILDICLQILGANPGVDLRGIYG